MNVQERKQAISIFLDAKKEPTALAQSISSASVSAPAAPQENGKTFQPGQEALEGPEDKGRLLTSKDKEIIKQAIEAATSIEEIKRLQRSLDEGFVPDLKELARLRGEWTTSRLRSLELMDESTTHRQGKASSCE